LGEKRLCPGNKYIRTRRGGGEGGERSCAREKESYHLKKERKQVYGGVGWRERPLAQKTLASQVANTNQLKGAGCVYRVGSWKWKWNSPFRGRKEETTMEERRGLVLWNS